MDITKLADEELEQMKEQIQFMKRHRNLIQKGTFYRLKNPFEGNQAAWEVISEDKREGLMAYYRVLQPTQGKFERIYFQGLEETEAYSVQECFGWKMNYGVHYGDELMYAGLSVSDCSSGLAGVGREKQGDFFSRLFYLKKES